MLVTLLFITQQLVEEKNFNKTFPKLSDSLLGKYYFP